jgi:hypothetical protein
MVGCSTVTIQRVENGSLNLSDKLANAILEATGADPVSLRSGTSGRALDMGGRPYSKSAFDFYQKVLPADDREYRYLVLTLSHQIQLLLLTSNRANQFKMRAVFAAIQNSLAKIAEDFALTNAIHRFLIATGHADKRKYRVHVAVLESRFSEVGAVVTIEAKSREEANSLRVDMSGSFDIGYASASVDSSLSKTSKDTIQQSKIDVKFYARGGDGLVALSDLLNVLGSPPAAGKLNEAMTKITEGIKSYVKTMDAKRSPAATYYCVPLAFYRQSLQLNEPVTSIRNRQALIAEGVVSRYHVLASAGGSSLRDQRDNQNDTNHNPPRPDSGYSMAQARAALDLEFFRTYYDPIEGRFRLPAKTSLPQIGGSFVTSQTATAVTRKYETTVSANGKWSRHTFPQGDLGNPGIRWTNWMGNRFFDLWRAKGTDASDNFETGPLPFDEANRLGKQHQIDTKSHWDLVPCPDDKAAESFGKLESPESKPAQSK